MPAPLPAIASLQIGDGAIERGAAVGGGADVHRHRRPPRRTCAAPAPSPACAARCRRRPRASALDSGSAASWRRASSCVFSATSRNGSCRSCEAAHANLRRSSLLRRRCSSSVDTSSAVARGAGQHGERLDLPRGHRPVRTGGLEHQQPREAAVHQHRHRQARGSHDRIRRLRGIGGGVAVIQPLALARHPRGHRVRHRQHGAERRRAARGCARRPAAARCRRR